MWLGGLPMGEKKGRKLRPVGESARHSADVEQRLKFVRDLIVGKGFNWEVWSGSSHSFWPPHES